jgi:aromatic-L-amino-acid decarboxylase
VKIAGLGKNSLRTIPVNETYAMNVDALERAIAADLKEGCTPLCVVAAIGTTGSTAIDPLRPIAEICRKHNLWLHVDAAYAGTALLLPEMRWMIDGIELVDSFVFNPHKWMFTNFDCSAYFVTDQEALVKTFEILPEYLKTAEGTRVRNYRDWGIQLGRRFRALKLWFVIRTYGVSGLQDMVRTHIELARSFAENVQETADFETLAPIPLATVCFRYHPVGIDDESRLNSLNTALMDRLNAGGRLYLTHTKLGGRVALRLVVGQTQVAQRHVAEAWSLITSTARDL